MHAQCAVEIIGVYMKAFRIGVLPLILVLCMVLTAGCYRYEADIKINSDGTSAYSVKVDIDKTAYINECKKGGASQKEINESLEEFKKAGYKTATVDGREYFEKTVRQNYKKGKLSEAFYEYDENAHADRKTVHFKINLRENVEVAEILAEMEYYGYKVTNDLITLTLNFEFPKEVVRTTGKKDSSNPKRVTFTANLGKTVTVFATTEKNVTLESFKIPGKVKISSLKANKSNRAVVKLKKVKYATGYDIHYSANNGYRNAVRKTTSKLSFTTGKLKKNKTYYFRIRAKRRLYTGKTVYGAWRTGTVKT